MAKNIILVTQKWPREGGKGKTDSTQKRSKGVESLEGLSAGLAWPAVDFGDSANK